MTSPTPLALGGSDSGFPTSTHVLSTDSCHDLRRQLKPLLSLLLFPPWQRTDSLPRAAMSAALSREGPTAKSHRYGARRTLKTRALKQQYVCKDCGRLNRIILFVLMLLRRVLLVLLRDAAVQVLDEDRVEVVDPARAHSRPLGQPPSHPQVVNPEERRQQRSRISLSLVYHIKLWIYHIFFYCLDATHQMN